MDKYALHHGILLVALAAAGCSAGAAGDSLSSTDMIMSVDLAIGTEAYVRDFGEVFRGEVSVRGTPSILFGTMIASC